MVKIAALSLGSVCGATSKGAKRQHPSYQECPEDQKASERTKVYQVSDAFFAAKAILPMMLMDHAPDGDMMSVSVNN
jgi:hypothetical protein